MQYTIRKYRPCDRGPVRKICADTALLGEPVEKCFDDRDIAADILISYYTDCEPESVFVAEADGEIAGYLAGCLKPRRRRKVFFFVILPSVLKKIAVRFTLLRKKTLLVGFNFLKSFLKGEFFHPDFHREFPASLHINVDARFRGGGIGTELLESCLDFLRKKNIKGVHLRTRSSGAFGFFAGAGFSLLYSRRITCLEYLGCRDLKLSILGKNLEEQKNFSNNLHKI